MNHLLNKRRAPSKYPDWASGLIKELLQLVLDKLPSQSDCVRFGAVCKPWRSLVMENRRCKIQSRPRIPLLLVTDGEPTSFSLYSITLGKIVQSLFPTPYEWRFAGSSHGWLATSSFFTNLSVIILVNPFTGDTIRLPRLFHGAPCNSNTFIRKVILSADPHMSPSDYTVVALHDIPTGSVAIIRSGDKAWTHIGLEDNGTAHVAIVNDDINTFTFENRHHRLQLCDVIYYKGQIHVVDCQSRLLSIDYTNSDSQVQVKAKFLTREATVHRHCTYLVESNNGDLLLVERLIHFRESDKYTAKTLKFKVFKLLSSTSSLVEMKSLVGGESLFLGVSHSMSITTSLFPGCHPNSIYYTEDYVKPPAPLYDCYGPDTGIFDLANGSISKHYIADVSHRFRPLWILPTMRGI